MDTTLRPLFLGEILDRTAELYRSNFLLFTGIASVHAGVLMVLGLVQIGVEEALRARHLESQIPFATIVGMLVMSPMVIIAGGLAVAANNRAVAWVYLQERATIRAAYASILPKLGRYLWLMIMTIFIVWLPFGLLYGAYAAFFILYAAPKGLFTRPSPPSDPTAILIFALVSVGFGLLILAAAVYAVLMGLRYSLAVPACVIEDLKARSALRRSIDLSKGSRGRIFLLALLVVAIQSGMWMITQLVFVVAIFKAHGQPPVWIRITQQLVAFCTNTLVGPIYATGFTLFYYDQRVRKEGYDIERMMRSAGLGEPAALPEAAASLVPAHIEDPLD